jgi:hypothetical protein
MSTWSSEDLARIGAADELRIAPGHPDGSPERYTPIWVVRVGDDLYVRSWHGKRGGWYRNALATHSARLRAGGVERDVTLTDAGDATDTPHEGIDREYRTKYARYDPTYVETMTGRTARAATLRLDPS